MTEGDGFEPTLARLREEREVVEKRLLERIDELATRAQRARDAALRAEELAREPATESVAAPGSGQVPPAPAEPAAQTPWGSATGWRRMLQGPIRWLLHDHLAVLDRRHRELARAVEQRDQVLREALEGIRRDVLAGLEALRAERTALLADERRRLEAVRELANRCVEGLDRVADVVLQTRELLNAKEAETVQVATEGLKARTGLLLEELARQQEALLAELVGRRRELDALLERARGDTGDGER